MMKTIALIGSSGSIGTQLLNVVRRNRERFAIGALVVHRNLDLLLRQIKEFSPATVGIVDEPTYFAAKEYIRGIELIGGSEALTYACQSPKIDIVAVAATGMSGLSAVIAAIENGKRIALANKESLVAAGEIINRMLAQKNLTIAPIDSEHSAIWQCLQGNRKEDVRRIILTASGGPFYGKSQEALKSVTPLEAVRHPTWNMGRKISVDSATMMNKALEIIEAYYLFGISQIDYVIHPESVIHSMVEYIDGSILSQMSMPSMELPIQLALSFPARLQGEGKYYDFSFPLHFSEPDERTFSAPKLAKECLKTGGTAPCIFNAANEACVNAFLQGKMRFTEIVDTVEKTLNNTKIINNPSLNDIYECYNSVVAHIETCYTNKDKE